MIGVPKFLPPSLIIVINQFNALYGEEPNEPPREWNIQPSVDHFKSITFTTKISHVVSAFMGRINHRAIDSNDFEVHTSEFPVELNSEYFQYPDTTLIKSISDYEMYHLLEFFHSEHDEYIQNLHISKF